MLTDFSKWLIYIASYGPVFLIILLQKICRLDYNEITLGMMSSNIKTTIVEIFILSSLLLFSVLVVFWLANLKSNERKSLRIKKNISKEMVSFVFPLLISFVLATLSPNRTVFIISGIAAVILGFSLIRADWIQIFPAFYYAGYRLFEDENGNMIFSKLTIEQYNTIIFEEPMGIEVRPITKTIYITTQKNKRYY